MGAARTADPLLELVHDVTRAWTSGGSAVVPRCRADAVLLAPVGVDGQALRIRRHGRRYVLELGADRQRVVLDAWCPRRRRKHLRICIEAVLAGGVVESRSVNDRLCALTFVAAEGTVVLGRTRGQAVRKRPLSGYGHPGLAP